MTSPDEGTKYVPPQAVLTSPCKRISPTKCVPGKSSLGVNYPTGDAAVCGVAQTDQPHAAATGCLLNGMQRHLIPKAYVRRHFTLRTVLPPIITGLPSTKTQHPSSPPYTSNAQATHKTLLSEKNSVQINFLKIIQICVVSLGNQMYWEREGEKVGLFLHQRE